MQPDPAPSSHPARLLLILDPAEIGLVRAAIERHAGVPDGIDARWHLPQLLAEAGSAVVDAGIGEPVLVPVHVAPRELSVVLGALKALQRDAAVHGELPDLGTRTRLVQLLGRLEAAA